MFFILLLLDYQLSECVVFYKSISFLIQRYHFNRDTAYLKRPRTFKPHNIIYFRIKKIYLIIIIYSHLTENLDILCNYLQCGVQNWFRLYNARSHALRYGSVSAVLVRNQEIVLRMVRV